MTPLGRLWIRLHGPLPLTSEREHDEADQRLRVIEEAARALETASMLPRHVPAVADRDRDDG